MASVEVNADRAGKRCFREVNVSILFSRSAQSNSAQLVLFLYFPYGALA